MNCTNCGAPTELFERRRYAFCQYCGAFHFLDAPAIDGLQVLARRKDARACRVCRGPLARAVLDAVNAVDYCERCRGVLLTRQSFAQVVAQRRAWATGPSTTPLPLDPRELERVIVCPACDTQMDVHPYYGPGNVVIDTCGTCDLVWLDFGELKQIVDAPGRDRGTGQPAPTRISRPRLDEAELEEPRLGISLHDLLDLFD
jgi:Zn-finger nucleic acid-binding protein